jgi:hypothetical protein
MCEALAFGGQKGCLTLSLTAERVGATNRERELPFTREAGALLGKEPPSLALDALGNEPSTSELVEGNELRSVPNPEKTVGRIAANRGKGGLGGGVGAGVVLPAGREGAVGVTAIGFPFKAETPGVLLFSGHLLASTHLTLGRRAHRNALV